MFVVDRDSFISWTQGILLDRDNSGKCVIGDNIAHEEAQERLDKGEIVGLSVKGVIKTTIQLVDEAYREKMFQHNESA